MAAVGCIVSCGRQSNDEELLNEEVQDTHTEVRTTDNDGYREELSNNTGVKVSINVNEDLDWEEFKSTFHVPTEEPESHPDNVAIGPWKEFDDFEYRRVYRLENNDLWIQTYFRRDETSNDLDANVTPKVLTLQESETNGMGSLWNEMLERGLYLTDSLSN